MLFKYITDKVLINQVCRKREDDDPKQTKLSAAEKHVKITTADIQSELKYWSPTLYCRPIHVVGDTPQLHKMENILRQMWANFGIQNIQQHKGGLLVKFTTMEDCKKAMKVSEGKPMPIIIALWSPDIDFADIDLRFRVWVNFKDLPLKLRSEHCLRKLSAPIGKFVRVDEAILNREKLWCAKVLVEVSVNQEFPKHIIFEDESQESSLGKIMLDYEWHPISCNKFNGNEIHPKQQEVEIQGAKNVLLRDEFYKLVGQKPKGQIGAARPTTDYPLLECGAPIAGIPNPISLHRICTMEM